MMSAVATPGMAGVPSRPCVRLSAPLRAMTASYAAKRSPWLSEQKKNKGMIDKARQKTEQLVFDYAVDLDRQGRAGNNQLYLWGATQLYALYVKTYPTAKRAFDVRNFQGQLLAAQGQYLAAANHMLAFIKEQREPPPKDATPASRESVPWETEMPPVTVGLESVNVPGPNLFSPPAALKAPVTDKWFVTLTRAGAVKATVPPARLSLAPTESNSPALLPKFSVLVDRMWQSAWMVIWA